MPAESSLLALSWSNKLGLALSGLFGKQDHQFGGGEHYALLDGVTASFSMSIADTPPQTLCPSEWAWSANLRKHVWVANESQVHVSTVAKPENVEKYSFTGSQLEFRAFFGILIHRPTEPKNHGNGSCTRFLG